MTKTFRDSITKLPQLMYSHLLSHTGKYLSTSSLDEKLCLEFHFKGTIDVRETTADIFFKPTAIQASHLTTEQFIDYHKSNNDCHTILQEYFAEFGIHEFHSNYATNTLCVEATIALWQEVLRVSFQQFQHELGFVYRVHDGTPFLPEEISQYVLFIEGLHNCPLESGATKRVAIAMVQEKNSKSFLGYTPLALAEAYDFPEGDGTDITVGIIELGGTYLTSDLQQYFHDLGLEVPQITTVGTTPNETLMNDIEVSLDIEVLGALLPKSHLVIYYATTLIQAIKQVISDTENRPSILSVSWAGSEFSYSEAELQALYELTYKASLMGITIVAASGDQGAFNNKSFLNVNVLASMPLVLACGGTKLLLNGSQRSREVVWNELAIKQGATGGGFSAKFPIPEYQNMAVKSYYVYQSNGAGVPDVAANADASTGYKSLFKGHYFPEGGTSAATPLWAALLGRISQQIERRLACVNPFLYQHMGSSVFHQIVEGNNGYFTAAAQWNPCTGLGSPNGKQLLEAFQHIES